MVTQPRPPRRCRRPAARPAPASSPSAITRIKGSVPDLRMTSRPWPSSSASAAAMRALTALVSSGAPPLKRTFLSSCGTGSNWRSSSLAGLPCLDQRGEHLQPGDQPVAGGRMVGQDDVPGLLAADVAAARRASPRARSGRRPGCGRGRCPLRASRRSSPRFDITVATTAPPLQLAAALHAASAISAISWSPSTSRPFSSTTISRSASPSSARPMSAPLVDHASPAAPAGAVEPQPSLMLVPLGVTPSGDDVGAQLPQRFGRDVIGGAVGAIDHDLEPVEPQPLGEGRLGEVDVAAARVVDPLARGRSARALAQLAAPCRAAARSRARPSSLSL